MSFFLITLFVLSQKAMSGERGRGIWRKWNNANGARKAREGTALGTQTQEEEDEEEEEEEEDGRGRGKKEQTIWMNGGKYTHKDGEEDIESVILASRESMV